MMLLLQLQTVFNKRRFDFANFLQRCRWRSVVRLNVTAVFAVASVAMRIINAHAILTCVAAEILQAVALIVEESVR